jgi:hypothetical protein
MPPTKTQVEPQTKAAPATATAKQPAQPEKHAGPVRPGLVQRASARALPPPDGQPSAARAGDMLANSEPGGVASRAQVMRAMQGTVGNARVSQIMRAPASPPVTANELDTAYSTALRSSNWQDAAEKLNGFNREDIQKRLAKLTPDQVAHIHQGALDNPRVGDQSQVAQMTAGPGAPVTIPARGTDVNKVGIVNHDREPQLRLRSSPNTVDNNVIKTLPFNTTVQVIKSFPGDWYFVSTPD